MLVKYDNKKEINVKRIKQHLEEISDSEYGDDYYNVKVNKEMLRDIIGIISKFEEIMPEKFDFNKGGRAHKVTKDMVIIFSN